MNDPIVDEVRRVRDAHAARFNYDLDAIFQDIKKREKESGLVFVQGVARQPGPNKALQPTGAAVSARKRARKRGQPPNRRGTGVKNRFRRRVSSWKRFLTLFSRSKDGLLLGIVGRGSSNHLTVTDLRRDTPFWLRPSQDMKTAGPNDLAILLTTVLPAV